MTLPAHESSATPADPPDAADEEPPAEAVKEDPGDEDAPPLPRHGLPGGRVVIIATLLVIGVAVAEVQLEERIGQWTAVTLIVVSVIGAIITRPGDRSLPAMMPPLAFLTAVLLAGQWLVPQSGNSLRTREAVMLVQTLGPNAGWVIIATVLAVSIAVIGHFVDQRIARRSTRREAPPTAA